MKLHDALYLMTVAVLKPRLQLLNETAKPTRKDDIISCIEAHMLGNRMLEYWQQLDALEQLAIAETVHCWGGMIYIRCYASWIRAIFPSAPKPGWQARLLRKSSIRYWWVVIFIQSMMIWA